MLKHIMHYDKIHTPALLSINQTLDEMDANKFSLFLYEMGKVYSVLQYINDNNHIRLDLAT